MWLVPDAEEVAAGIAEGGDAAQALGGGAGDGLASVSADPCERILDLVDVMYAISPGGGGQVVADPTRC